MLHLKRPPIHFATNHSFTCLHPRVIRLLLTVHLLPGDAALLPRITGAVQFSEPALLWRIRLRELLLPFEV